MPAAQRPDWRGRTVVCIASGPSLTPEDCDLVRAAGHPVIVTNTSFRIAPWADMLFGFDARWWREHLPEVRRTFKGRLVSASQLAVNYGVESTFGCTWFSAFGSSGPCAVSMAVAGRAQRVVLLGFDCTFAPDGRKHWHGDHPKGFTNCLSIKRWPKQFKYAARLAQKQGVPVVNASRRTALDCFERVELERALQG